MVGGTGTMRTLRNHIGGEWVESSAGDYLELTNPATAEPLCRVPLSTARDVDQAVAAARAAFPAWRAVPPVVRARHLFRLKHVLDQQFDEIAAIITRENGKTLDEARGSLRRGIENVEHACGIPTLMMGRALEDVAAGIDCEYVRQPLGVFTAVTPFNFPAMVPMWFWPYAIAAGNTFILKPSEQVPLTATRIAELAHEAGFPPGVLNLVHGGKEAVQALLEHPDVAGISFVGSSAVARHVYAEAAKHGKRAQALGALAVLRRLRVDVPGDGRRTHERDPSDIGVFEQGLHCLLPAVHQVEDARRETGFVRQLRDAGRRERHLFAGLQDEGVACGDGVGPEPHGDHRRKVEGRDRGEHAERLTDVFAIDACGDVFERPPHHQGGDAARVLHVLDAAPQRAPGFVEGLAVLARDDGRDLIEPLVQDVLEPEQMARPHYRGDGAPGGERRPGGGDRLIYVTRRRQGYPTQRLGGGGVGDVETVARGGLDPLAADMVPQSAHGARPAKLARAALIRLAVARASRHQSLAAPLLEDLLRLLVCLVQRLLGAHPSRRGVGEHGGQDERVEDLALRRVRGSRVSDVRRPFQRRADRLELSGRVRAERVVRRHLLEPLVARRRLLGHRDARLGHGAWVRWEIVELAGQDGVAVAGDEVEEKLLRDIRALGELPDRVDPHHVLACPLRSPRALERRDEEDVVRHRELVVLRGAIR